MKRANLLLLSISLIASPIALGYEVVVTATRMAQTADQTLVPVTVVTRKDIEQSPANSVPELLRMLPGIDISKSGGYGTRTSMFLRGTNPDHVLVIIDGVKVGSATSGDVSFEHLPLSQVERVEVVRGPRSSLYGSEAVGGVIQIFTRRAMEGPTGDAKVGYGSYGTENAEASIASGNENGGAKLRVSHIKTDGINALDGSNPDRDGYRNNSLTFNLHKALNDDVRIEFNALRAKGNNDFDGFPDAADLKAEAVQQTLSTRLQANVTDYWDLSLQASENRDESNSFENDNQTSFFDTKRWQLDFKNDLYFNDNHILTLGVDYQDDEVDSTTAFTVTSRDNVGSFGQWQAQFNRWSLLAGLRTDDNEQFGRNNTGNLNLGYDLGEGHRLLLSYGTAFHAPTFNDLFFPPSFGFQGNPDLQPEESETWEIGYEFGDDRLRYAVRAFTTNIDDLIINDFSGPIGQPVNLYDARIDGLEFELATQLAGWDARFSASVLDAIDADSKLRLSNRAERTAQIDISRTFGKLKTNFNLLAQGDRFSDIANTNKLSGYGLVNLWMSYPITEHLTLDGRINNLFDRDYATNADFSNNEYNTLGLNYLISLKYSR